jgi:SAM-dependent methyltransferase
MKDIVENRKRISLSRKLRLALLALRENGPWWCFLLAVYLITSAISHRAFGAMDRLRRSRGIPGMNSAALNKAIWEAWDWSGSGDEWTASNEWKESLVRCVLERHVANNARILEIGPGAGRWTEYLLRRARSYIGIDISSTCVEHCAQQFRNVSAAKFVVGSGSDLRGIGDASIDVIWSFDVFVHINSLEVESYAREFSRVLVPGAIAVIHHGAIGGAAGGWRSDLTSSRMRDILSSNALSLEESLTHWTDDGEFHQLNYGDLISVIRKPVAEPALARIAI